MRLPRVTTIDFETLPIEDRPAYPPPAVGVSIKRWGRKPVYYAWGHPEGNTHTWAEARAAVAVAYANPDGVVFQNGKFDLDVAEKEFGLAPPPPERVHDTMLLLFLDDPHQTELGLKPSAERLLDWPAEERDAVVDWLIEHQPLKRAGVKMGKGQGKKKADSQTRYAGAYVALTPVSVAGPYANGDVERTEALFRLLYPRIVERGMEQAYLRERRLLPVLLRMEREGIAVDLARLERDVAVYAAVGERLDAWLRRKLRAPELNLDSADQLVQALLAAGLVREQDLLVTAGGKLSSSKDSLDGAVRDAGLKAALRYRAGLKTALGTFLGPWLAMARASGGRIYTTWNQVRAPKGGDLAGTRTGRLSATWFMNMPKEFTHLFREHAAGDEARKLPKAPLDLPPLPNCRDYVVPFKGHVLIDRDYSQQEPRILGHFDGGELMDRYNAEPWVDFHDYAKAELALRGLHYERKPVKNTNLGLIYGMGVGKLADKNGMTVEAAKDLQTAVLALYPGLEAMRKDMKRRAQLNEPIRTWGGREYYCEPPRLVEGRWRTFDYKLVNILIQGSAADCTKEAILALDAAIERRDKRGAWFLILNVHDQLTMSVPTKDRDAAMAVLRECMEGVAFDVPMLSEGAWSPTSWGSLTDYDKKGKLLVKPYRRRTA